MHGHDHQILVQPLEWLDILASLLTLLYLWTFISVKSRHMAGFGSFFVITKVNANDISQMLLIL